MSSSSRPLPFKGLAVVVSAPSGTGKTTLLKRLRRRMPEAEFSVSCTTRRPRRGEKDRRDYHFLSERTFRSMAARDGFLEWAEVYGKCYGTPRRPALRALASGKTVLFDVDHQGAEKLRRAFGASCIMVLLLPPGAAELRRRMRGRGGMAPDAMRRRLREAHLAAAAFRHYDYVLINDDLDHCVTMLHLLVRAARLTSARQAALVERFVRECRVS
jgi:guanylate kinase